jgi:hypothetical protein
MRDKGKIYIYAYIHIIYAYIEKYHFGDISNLLSSV